MRDHLRTELASTALLMAAQQQRPAKGLIAHSDRGSQYASGSYRALLEAWGMRQSMSRNGCCYDNAPMESFFHTLKVELVHQERLRFRQRHVLVLESVFLVERRVLGLVQHLGDRLRELLHRGARHGRRPAPSARAPSRRPRCGTA